MGIIRHMPRKFAKNVGTVLIGSFLVVFLLWPLADVVRKAFWDADGFTTAYLVSLVTTRTRREAIINSLRIALWSTALALLIALPLAWLAARRRFPGRHLLSGMVMVPLILPPFVGAIGMKTLLARFGPLTTLLNRLGVADGPIDWLGAFPLLGVVVMESLHLFPILYLNLVAAFANIDPSLEEAAANLGARPWRIFGRVTLPLAGPGLFAGIVLVFIWSFTELGTPLVFGFRRVLPVMIYDSVSEVGTNPSGFAQVVFLMAVAATGFYISRAITRRNREVATLGRLVTRRQETALPAWGTGLLWFTVAAVLTLATIPHLSVVLLAVSRRWSEGILPTGWTLEFFRRAVGSDLTRHALANSLLLSLLATVLALTLGFGIAWLHTRRKACGAAALDALAMVPLAVPGIVVAFGYLTCFGRWKVLDPRLNPMLLLVVAYAVRRLPFLVRAASAGLEQISTIYEEAAANLGARPWRVIRRITFPLVSANLLAGGILCFTFSMLEVSDSMVLAQAEEFYPITKAIYTLSESLENGLNVASALGVWAMGLLASAMLWTSTLLGEKMGQMFRAG